MRQYIWPLLIIGFLFFFLTDGKPTNFSERQQAQIRQFPGLTQAVIAKYVEAGRQVSLKPPSGNTFKPVAVSSDGYKYVGPPTISKAVYVEEYCTGANPQICEQAPSMYDTLVAAGLNPAAELAHSIRETSKGTAGVGRPPLHNLHAMHCFGDYECAYNGVPGDMEVAKFKSYPEAVAAWAWLIKEGGLYYPKLNDPWEVTTIYCECGGGSVSQANRRQVAGGKQAYADDLADSMDAWRERSK